MKSTSRSAKRFEKELTKAVTKREQFLEKGKLSLPRGLGKIAIVVSNHPNEFSSADADTQIGAFLAEADEIKSNYEADNKTVELHRKASAGILQQVLTDPEVTDITLIGHGSIGDFWIGQGHFGWSDFSAASNHLKQGNIIQRVCGHYPLKTSIATGTFSVADQRNIVAPHGKTIEDINPDESLFVPVYAMANNSVEDLLAINHQYFAPEEK